MGLLSTLLHEASARRPAEVVIETDRPVRIRLTDGTSTELTAAIGGTAISDALSDLLTTDQQVDLALGESVKFDLVVGLYTWHLVGETAREVVLVRACPNRALLEGVDVMPSAMEADEVEVEVDTYDVPRVRRALPSSGPSEIDIDVNFDDEAASSSAEGQEQSRGLRLAALAPTATDTKPQPMWPRRVARTGAERGGRAATRSAAGSRVTGPQAVVSPRSEVSTPSRRTSMSAGLRREEREEREEMAELLAAFEPGSLALLLRAPGRAQSLAAALGQPTLTISDDDTPAQVNARLGGLGPAGVLIVRAEDPSLWLGWLLRRVEEGRRVIVETAAQTPAGARRSLLGVGATPRAELWLEAVRVLSVTISDDRWALLSPGH